MINTDLDDKWWCKIRKDDNKASSTTQQRYSVELLSLAKQAQPISFQTMYLMFFRSFKNKTGLSIFFIYFLKSLLAHSIAIYKWKWYSIQVFIDNLIALFDPFPSDLAKLTRNFLYDFFTKQEDSLRRLFLVKMQSQHYRQLQELLNYELYQIIDLEAEQMVELQTSALPINFPNFLKECGESYIKDSVLTTIRKLQHLMRTFPVRRYTNYFNFIQTHTKYFQIQPQFSLQQNKEYKYADKFLFVRSKRLLSFDKANEGDENILERMKKFQKLLEADLQYYLSTKKYYPKIDQNSINFDQIENKWKFEIEKPFLDSVGLLVEPFPVTAQLQLISFTPNGNQSMTTFWEQKHNWFFIKECLVNNDQEEEERNNVLQENHVFRLLLLGYHILTKKRFPTYAPHQQQSQNMAMLAKSIKQDPYWVCAFLPGFPPPESFSLKLQSLLEWTDETLNSKQSQMQKKGFLQLKRVATYRLMLLKRIIALLAHKKYFGRLLNAKKYLIIFHLTAIQLIFLFYNIAKSEERRPFSAPFLREELVRSFEALNKSDPKQNYQYLAYSKIQLYKTRKDDQFQFLKKQQLLTLNAAKINEQTTKMRQINIKMLQIEKKMGEGYNGYNPKQQRMSYNNCIMQMNKFLQQCTKICFQGLQKLNNDLQFRQNGKSLHKMDEDNKVFGNVLTKKLALMIEICLKLNIQNMPQIETHILPLLLLGQAGEVPQQKMNNSDLQMTNLHLMEAQKISKEMYFCCSNHEPNTNKVDIKNLYAIDEKEQLYQTNSQCDDQFKMPQLNDVE